LYTIPTIGVTGSNAKTIIKEWLFQLLSPDYSIVKSPKSYNSQIGVPLSVWQMRPEHTLAIFEAGISQMGEMEKLAAIISPTIGIFTNIGPAHSEGFPSLQAKIAQKAMLFTVAEKIIYCKDHTQVAAYLEENFSSQKLVAWGKSAAVKYKIKEDKEGISVQGKTFKIPFKDEASIENLLHCVVLMLELEVEPDIIQNRILGLANIPMRLELKAGRHNCYLIDDTYNNDPEGLKIALQFMQQQDMKRRKVVILSDMLETGIYPHVLYGQVAALLKEKNIDLLIAVGSEIGKYQHLFSQKALFYSSTEALMGQLSALPLHDSLLLVKGARMFRFERIVQQLAQKIHRTVLEINLNALAHNLNMFRQMLKPGTKMMVMVKAFAYGSGSHEVAHLLQYHKVDYLAVAYTDEALELRENNITLPVMVMNPSPDERNTIWNQSCIVLKY
jgi:alanine racemase